MRRPVQSMKPDEAERVKLFTIAQKKALVNFPWCSTDRGINLQEILCSDCAEVIQNIRWINTNIKNFSA